MTTRQVLNSICVFSFIPLFLTAQISEEKQTGTHTNSLSDTSNQSTPWPQWIFHHWVWEDESTQQSAIDLVDGYIQHTIPVGAIIIDSPWETGYNTFEFDKSIYGDAQGMINNLHSKDVRVMLWITGIINTDEDSLFKYAQSKHYFLEGDSSKADTTLVKWWKGKGKLIDFYNPDAVTWWRGLTSRALDLGIDGWKCDGTDYYTVSTPYSPYLDTVVNRLDYSHKYYNYFFNETRKVLGKDRIITGRPIDNYGLVDMGGDLFSFAPVEINFAGWVGDQDPTFEGLTKALNNMYHSSEMGYLAFGSDIGGYRSDNQKYPGVGRSKELFIRWAQMGALSPIMENGGADEHRPWMFDTETTDIYREFTNLHYDLIPYFMVEAEKAWKAKKSMMQFFNKTDYSYLLGEDVFVTPFLTSGTSIDVTFPTGDNWVYVFDTAKVYSGGTTQTLNITLDKFPVFIKQNSAVYNDIILDVYQPSATNTIEIYPNPVSSSSVITYSNVSHIKHTLKITDITGRVVREEYDATGRYILNKKELAPGIYTVVISNNNNHFSEKVVIQ